LARVDHGQVQAHVVGTHYFVACNDTAGGGRESVESMAYRHGRKPYDRSSQEVTGQANVSFAQRLTEKAVDELL